VTTSSCGPFRLAACQYVAILTALDEEAIEPTSPTRERELPAHVDAAATSGGRVDIVDTLTISFGKIPLLAADSCHFGSKQLIHQNQFATQLHVTSTHGYSQDKLWSQTGWLDGTLQMPRILHGVPTSCCIGHEWPWV